MRFTFAASVTPTSKRRRRPAVGVIVDGVYQGSSTGQLIDTFDVKQMEINRGPQGVLQGKNTTGGSIVVTRYRPEFNDFAGMAAVQGGDYDDQQFKGRINIPLIEDQLAMKIAGITKTQNGFYDNTTEGCKDCAGDIDYKAATAAIRWQPMDEFDATLTYDYIDDTGDIPPQDPTWNGDNPFKNAANYDEFQEYDVDAYALHLAYTFDFGTLSSISSYNDGAGQRRPGFRRRRPHQRCDAARHAAHVARTIVQGHDAGAETDRRSRARRRAALHGWRLLLRIRNSITHKGPT